MLKYKNNNHSLKKVFQLFRFWTNTANAAIASPTITITKIARPT